MRGGRTLDRGALIALEADRLAMREVCFANLAQGLLHFVRCTAGGPVFPSADGASCGSPCSRHRVSARLS